MTYAQAIIDLIEKRRWRIVNNPNDPSWTEHFAELANEVRMLPVYTHRNGEKVAPTVEGRYWFYGEIDGRKKAEIFTVVSSPMLGVMEYDRLTVNDDGGVTFRAIADFSGQWWGPLHAPWEGE